MQFTIRYFKVYILVIIGILVSSCAGNTSNSSNNSSNLSLNEYINMLEYTPTNSISTANNIQIASATAGQQSFTADGSITLTTVKVDFYGSNDCNEELLSTVLMNASTPMTMPAGTYRSTNKSNFALASRYQVESTSVGADSEFNQTNSIKFTYTYNEGPKTASQCLTNPNMSNSERIANYISTPVACTNDTSCGFSQNYNITLVTGDYGVVDVSTNQSTDAIVMGTGFNFTASISGANGDNSTVSASIVDPTLAVITSDPSPCIITVGGTASCTFTAISLWNTLFTNNNDTIIGINISASNNVLLNNSVTQYTSVTPSVYLLAMQSGDASLTNVGITYSNESGRFINASNNQGVECVNGLVDTKTNLMWVKNTALLGDGTWGEDTDFNTAQYKVKEMNLENPVCGYTNWRMANITEVMSLLNAAETSQASWLSLEGFTGDNVGAVANGDYWVSTPQIGDLSETYYVYFSNSSSDMTIYTDDEVSASRPFFIVRDYTPENNSVALTPSSGTGSNPIVTQGVVWPSSRFESDITGDCMIDKLTGLVWTKDLDLLGTATSGNITDSNTIQYKIEQINTNDQDDNYHLCGYDDWRIPNIRELNSLINYGVNNPVEWLKSNGFIMNAFDYNMVRSASLNVNNTSNSWSVNLYSGSISTLYANSFALKSFMVRGGNKAP